MAVVVLLAAALRLVALDRYPPGLHFDEAVYGLLARDIWHGARPVFFSAYTGRETLYMYLMAALFAAIGPTAFALRLTSALAGVLTVPLTYALGRALYGRRVGFAAALLLSVQYWHLTVSRNGYPNVLIPPLEAASALFLWRAWQHNRRRDWLLGGALAGLVLHTYLAARFWPVLLAAALLYALAMDRGRWRACLGGILLAVAAAAVVFAPLAVHFWRHPQDFWERANQVLAWRQLHGRQLAALYASNVRETAAGFLGRGDPRWHFNLPGRPIFQPLVGLLFLVGLSRCLARLRELRFALPVLWVLVMSLPGILTLEMQPAGQRMFGVFPALVLLPALGVVVVVDGLRYAAGRAAVHAGERCLNRLPLPGVAWSSVLFLAVVAAVAAVDGAMTVRDYFLVWARRPETAHIFNADYVLMARSAAADLTAGRTVVLLTEHYKHATVAFLAPETVEGAVWADGRLALPLPNRPGFGNRAGSAEVVYYRPTSYLDDHRPAVRWLEREAYQRQRLMLEAPRLPIANAPSLEVVRYLVRAADVPPPGPVVGQLGEVRIHAAGAVGLGPGSRLLPVERDRTALVPVEWSVVALPDGGRGFALHVRHQVGITWAQADVSGYLADQWRPGDRVWQWFAVPLDPEMPPGSYQVYLIVVDEGGQPLAGSWPSGTGTALPLGSVPVVAGDDYRSCRGMPPLGSFGGLVVIDYQPVEVERAPGETFDVTIRWCRRGEVRGLEEASFELVSELPAEAARRGAVQAKGPRVSRVAHLPVAADYPPRQWAEGEILRGRYRLRVPARLGQGYHLLRLRVPPAAGELELGTVRVVVGERRFSPPPVQHPLGATFGGRVQLVGYDLGGRLRPGAILQLTLYWQARAGDLPSAKVFTHLLNEQGQLVAQHDAVPAGTRPLEGWLVGEYVTDPHPIQLPGRLPPGTYHLEVGLYDPADGHRWPIEVGAGGGRVKDGALSLPGPGGALVLPRPGDALTLPGP